uniref:ribosomal protein S8 n=1 Tax=Cephaleuros diffusus TaxID=1519597 RepID=UPI0030017C4F
MIHAIKRVSKPSLRWYLQNPIPQSLGGLGIFIVSTSFGIVTDFIKEAREKKLGGEILLEIW